MTPYQHQIEGSKELVSVLRQNGLAYIAYEERVGKTLTILLALDQTVLKRVLVLTKKAALPGWIETVEAHKSHIKYTITNYEQAKNLCSSDFDALVLDESHHALAAYPKPSMTWKTVKLLSLNKPIIFSSATPYPESLSQMYHQLALSTWSPFFKYSNFYAWHKDFGIENEMWLGGRKIKQYNLTQDQKILEKIKPLIIHKTRVDVGFEHEPSDKLHKITLSEDTQEIYSKLEKDSVAYINGETVVAETPAALMQKLAQLVGGTIIIDEKGIKLNNTEKIDYIKRTFGDSEDVVIMYNYKQEEFKLKEAFKKATVLQGDRFAEGVDLSHFKTLVVYSMSFGTSKYIQRRARQANKKRDEEIIVHYILTGKIDSAIYSAVALKKKNFTSRLYNERE